MKTRLLLVTALAALVTSGCGQKDTSTSGAAAAPAGPREIEITGGDTMKSVSYTHLDVYKRQSIACFSVSRPVNE